MAEKTRIVYETELDCLYDLEGNEYQFTQMCGKVQRMRDKFGSLQAFRKKLDDEAQGLRLALSQKVAKWFTLVKQIEFIDKVIAGDILLLAESEEIDGVPGPEAAH